MPRKPNVTATTSSVQERIFGEGRHPAPLCMAIQEKLGAAQSLADTDVHIEISICRQSADECHPCLLTGAIDICLQQRVRPGKPDRIIRHVVRGSRPAELM